MDNNDNAKMPKKCGNFTCEYCDFKCTKKSNYLCHIKTKKHNDNKMITNDNKLQQKNAECICKCGNVYKYMSGLSRHKKQCSFIDKINKEIPQIIESNVITTELIMELIKDNKEMKQIISDLVSDQNNTINTLIKNGISNTTIQNTNCNNNNKTFNLHLFLNETCKDAMNITDFIDSIKLELSDLIKVGEVGYVEGISNIITSNLKALDITKRPVHCTDKKRETIYIKDEDKWEKDENKTKLKKIINRVSHKNIKLITEYREKYPDCKKSDYKLSDKYNKMIIEAMGGPGDNNKEKEEKIIKNISKCTTIEKYSEM